ncbi:MAG: MerR family transcriptional regulator [Anaerolineales bacterium]|jgi:DNA-binding transcriptional MerR regulator|nr:MerR family transcriptional regulator [Anaerolineales bacterium]
MFTVKQLATLAGVTPRTLHHYDQIGLLKPSQIGENGYRYYGAQAALALQQILFYRELGLTLEDIKKIMGRPDFDVLAALESHKTEIARRIRRLEQLVGTVDNTIASLKGQKNMDNKQIFAGFTPEQEERYALEAEEMYDPATVRESNRKWKTYGKEKQQAILAESKQLYIELVAAMPQGADAPEVQALIERWRAQMDYFWTPSPAQLLSLAEGYVNDPRFRATYDAIDPKLAEFMLAAVKTYLAARP